MGYIQVLFYYFKKGQRYSWNLVFPVELQFPDDNLKKFRVKVNWESCFLLHFDQNA